MDYLQALEVGSGFGLVFGDQQMPTAALETERGLLIVRWRTAPNEDAVRHALGNLDDLDWIAERFTLRVDGQPLRLFPARRQGLEIVHADEDPEDEDWPEVPLKAGTYSLATAEWDPNDTLSLVLHAIMRSGD